MRRGWILLLLPVALVAVSLTAVWPDGEDAGVARTSTSKSRKARKAKRRATTTQEDEATTRDEQVRELGRKMKQLAAARDTDPPTEPGDVTARPPRHPPHLHRGEGEADAEADAGEEPEAEESGPGDAARPASRDGIRAAVADHVDEIKECYDAWLETEPELEGRLVVQFTIEADDEEAETGRVTEVALADSEIDHAVFTGCVLNVFQGLEFEAPEDDDGVAVKYPLQFSSDDDAEEDE